MLETFADKSLRVYVHHQTTCKDIDFTQLSCSRLAEVRTQ